METVKPYIEVIGVVATVIGVIITYFQYQKKTTGTHVKPAKPDVVKWRRLFDVMGGSKDADGKFVVRQIDVYCFDTSNCDAPRNIAIIFNTMPIVHIADSQTIIDREKSDDSYKLNIHLGAKRISIVSFFFDAMRIGEPQLACKEVALERVSIGEAEPYIRHWLG